MEFCANLPLDLLAGGRTYVRWIHQMDPDVFANVLPKQEGTVGRLGRRLARDWPEAPRA